MRITADTNLLVRALVGDDPVQARSAREALAAADVIAVTLPALCELVWVLARGYRLPADQIADAVRRLMDAASVTADRPAVAAGLAVLEAGGDFADGVIAFEGASLGGELFLSFDRRAVRLVEAAGLRARMLG